MRLTLYVPLLINPTINTKKQLMCKICKNSFKKYAFPLLQILVMLLSVFSIQGQVNDNLKMAIPSPVSFDSKTDTLPKAEIRLNYDMNTWLTQKINQQLYVFYDETGTIAHSFISNRPPERSPYNKLKFPYFIDRELNQDYISDPAIDTMEMIGYFDLENFSFSERKRIFKQANVFLPDSIIKRANRIYHSPPSVESFNKHFLITNSTFGVINKSKNTIWRSEFISVYGFKFNITKELEINEELYSTKCISSDGRYMLLVQMRSMSDSGLDTSDELSENISNSDYNFPMKLIDMETSDQKSLKIDIISQPVTDIKYFNEKFHVIFGNEMHTMIDIKNKKIYTRTYVERKTESLMSIIKRDAPNTLNYRMSNF